MSDARSAGKHGTTLSDMGGRADDRTESQEFQTA